MSSKSVRLTLYIATVNMNQIQSLVDQLLIYMYVNISQRFKAKVANTLRHVQLNLLHAKGIYLQSKKGMSVYVIMAKVMVTSTRLYLIKVWPYARPSIHKVMATIS